MSSMIRCSKDVLSKTVESCRRLFDIDVRFPLASPFKVVCERFPASSSRMIGL